MLARVQSYVLFGIDALPCEVEVDCDVRNERHTQTVVGLPDAAVKESIQRVQSALLNSGFNFPPGRVLINLAPADVRKEGPLYDLPIALGLLMAQGIVAAAAAVGGKKSAAHSSSPFNTSVINAATTPAIDSPELDPRQFLFAGELALDGRVRPVKGVIAMAALARQRHLRGVFVPRENAEEAAVVEGIDAIGVSSLAELIGIINGVIDYQPHPPVDLPAILQSASAPLDFADVRGQEAVKRALVVAAAGSHNILMLGPAGTGKTMMARALPGILPPLTPEEALETTRIYSAAGVSPSATDSHSHRGLVTIRPVRSPHHTASSPAIVGGGMIPRPGEISLAHHGILFLDELPEFPRDVLETLRQPLEEQAVSIARAHSAVRFPANFMLVAAMNPTPKGDMPTDDFGKRAMDRYLSRISGPLVDRIDIHVEAPAVPIKQLQSAPRGTPSTAMRQRVLAARHIQQARQGRIPNARLTGKQLDQFAQLQPQAQEILAHAMTELQLSARAYDKIRRVARTIADLEAADSAHADATAPLSPSHVMEAVSYRLLDRKT